MHVFSYIIRKLHQIGAICNIKFYFIHFVLCWINVIIEKIAKELFTVRRNFYEMKNDDCIKNNLKKKNFS